MRKSTKFIGALAAAGLVAAGVSASTASNTLPAGGVSGYGVSTATGATVTVITNNLVSGDASKLEEVVFTTTTDTTGKTAQLTLKNSGTIVGSSYSCIVTGSVSPWTITCNATDDPLLSTFNETGLTVS